MNNIDNEIKSTDYLAMLGTFLGVLNYSQNLRQTSNDDLMEETKRQTDVYLKEIIRQNNEILRRLDDGFR